MSFSTLDRWLFIITTFACFVIFLPLILYHGYKYFLNRNNILMQKRLAWFTIIEVILAVIKFFSNGLSYIIALVTNNNIAIQKERSNAISLLAVTASVLWHCIEYLWIIRFFILSYQLNFTNFVLNYTWQSIINKASQNDQLEWYLTKKSKYNNILWVSLIFSPLFIAQNVTAIMSSRIVSRHLKYDNDTYNDIQYLDVALTTPSYIILFIIYYTIPRVKDNFYISGELTRMFIFFVIWTISIIIELIFAMFLDTSLVYVQIAITLTFVSFYLCDLGVILITTWWVNKKVIYLQNNYSIKTKERTFSFQPSTTKKGSWRDSFTKSASKTTPSQWSLPILTIENVNNSHVSNKYNNYKNNSYNKNKVETNKEYTIKDYSKLFVKILLDKNEFERFADHIIKDMLIKHLLAFIEIIQLQKYLAEQRMMRQRVINNDHIFDDDDDEKLNDEESMNKSKSNKSDKSDKSDQNVNEKKEGLFTKIRFHHSITLSYIVYNKPRNYKDSDYMYHLKDKVHKLFEKYVEYGSDYEIDITKNEREKLINLMMHKDDFLNSKMSINKLILLFEGVVKELLISLVDSFIRYKQSLHRKQSNHSITALK